MPILSKTIYMLNVITIKISKMNSDLGIITLIPIGNYKRPQRAKAILNN